MTMTWNTVGFEPQKRYFRQLIEERQLAHAYLFTGLEMTGKFLFAREIAARANGRTEVGEFDPDLKIVTPNTAEGETKIYVEDIRDIKAFLSLRPYRGPYKFVIVDNADRLTVEAANALLKSLEEPTPNTVLILVSSQPRQLLATVSSRCQEVRFLPHGREAIADYLAERKKVLAADRDLLISMAQGRIGWLEPALARLPEIKKTVSELDAVLRSGTTERMLYAKKIYEKETYPAVVADWLYWLYGNRQRVPRAHAVLGCLLDLNALIAQPQYNHRLALETTFVNL